MRGNSHVRFLGEGATATSFPYPTEGRVWSVSLSAWLVRRPKVFPAYYTPADTKWPEAFWFGDRQWGLLMACMNITDVLDNDARCPSLPNWPPKGLSREATETLGEEFSEVFSRRERRSQMKGLSVRDRAILVGYHAKTDAALGSLSTEVSRSKPPGCRRVPHYKFQTNDWWLVSPEECRSIARVMAWLLAHDEDLIVDLSEEFRVDRKQAVEWVQRWTSYNRLAARCGGYRVV